MGQDEENKRSGSQQQLAGLCTQASYTGFTRRQSAAMHSRPTMYLPTRYHHPTHQISTTKRFPQQSYSMVRSQHRWHPPSNLSYRYPTKPSNSRPSGSTVTELTSEFNSLEVADEDDTNIKQTATSEDMQNSSGLRENQLSSLDLYCNMPIEKQRQKVQQKNLKHNRNNVHFIEAKQFLQKAVEISKKTSCMMFVDLARVTIALEGKYEEVVECFENASKCEPFVAKTDLAYLYETWGRYEEDLGKQEYAKRLYRRAIECAAQVNEPAKLAYPRLRDVLNADRKGRNKVKSLRELAKLHEIVRQHGKSIDYLHEAYEINPNDPSTLKQLITSLHSARKDDEANMYLTLLESTGDSLEESLGVEIKLIAAETWRDVNVSTAIEIYRDFFRHFTDAGGKDINPVFDVLILSSEEDVEIGANLSNIIQHNFGLSVCFPYQEMPLGSSIMDYHGEVIDKSAVILVILSEKLVGINLRFCTLAISEIGEREYGKVVGIKYGNNLPKQQNIMKYIGMNNIRDSNQLGEATADSKLGKEMATDFFKLLINK